MILKDITVAKLPRTTRIGSDSSVISLDAIERPSILLPMLDEEAYRVEFLVLWQNPDP